MTRKIQSRMMGEKSLGKPNYNKWEKRAYRIIKKIRRRESRPDRTYSIGFAYHPSRPVIAEREHIFYPDDWGYQRLPRINVYIRLKGKLRILVIKLPNRRVMRINRERDVIGSERYVWRDGDGTMKGGQVRKESPIERPGIWLY